MKFFTIFMCTLLLVCSYVRSQAQDSVIVKHVLLDEVVIIGERPKPKTDSTSTQTKLKPKN